MNKTQQKSCATELLSIAPNPHQAVDAVNCFFVNIGANLTDKIICRNPQTSLVIDASACNSFVLLETVNEEVESILISLENCAEGWDGISSTILKSFKDVLVPHITRICDLCKSQGLFPDVLKKTIIHPIRDRVTY